MPELTDDEKSTIGKAVAEQVVTYVREPDGTYSIEAAFAVLMHAAVSLMANPPENCTESAYQKFMHGCSEEMVAAWGYSEKVGQLRVKYGRENIEFDEKTGWTVKGHSVAEVLPRPERIQ